MDVTVAVGTFGGPEWAELAQRRAIPSARAEHVTAVHAHAATLHDARNQALDEVDTEWVCFLDADDELECGYFLSMARAVADVRAPSVRYQLGSHIHPAQMPRVHGHRHNCSAECIPFGNWLVVGAVARTELIRKVGGWRDWPKYEDWDLWARCWQAGATFEPVPAAVYRAHVRPDSRNRLNREDGIEVHRDIARDLGLPVP